MEPIDRVPRMLQARELTGGLPFADESDAGAESGAAGDPAASRGSSSPDLVAPGKPHRLDAIERV
jgi:hypothetical protein